MRGISIHIRMPFTSFRNFNFRNTKFVFPFRFEPQEIFSVGEVYSFRKNCFILGVCLPYFILTNVAINFPILKTMAHFDIHNSPTPREHLSQVKKKDSFRGTRYTMPTCKYFPFLYCFCCYLHDKELKIIIAPRLRYKNHWCSIHTW